MSHFSVRTKRPVAAVALAALASLAAVAPVSAEDAHPFEVFRDCPADQMVAAGAGDGACIAAVVKGGSFTIGKGTVPITAESHLSTGQATVGGKDVDFGTPGRMFVSSPMQVPGGLLGVKGLERLVPGLTDIRATVELATDEVPSVNVLNAVFGGTVVVLPIKIRLQNALLGDKCYIGSDAHPIVLELSTGPTAPPAPNTPISGTRGELTFVPVSDTASLIKGSGAVLVDNAFSVPGATGCGPAGTLNATVNQRQGLPSPAGRNTAILEQDFFLGGPAADVLAFQGQG